jgi:dynactin complex subunit
MTLRILIDTKEKCTMSEINAYIGQRLSLKSQTCTVRYIGQVADKQGQWLGVEWDDASRGKHDGTHQRVSYFKCRLVLLYFLKSPFFSLLHG